MWYYKTLWLYDTFHIIILPDKPHYKISSQLKFSKVQLNEIYVNFHWTADKLIELCSLFQ